MLLPIIIRLLVTLALLVFVWRGDMWAIKLSITLITIGMELISFTLNCNVKKGL